MNSGAKLIIGLIIFLIGIYWYTAGPIFHHGGIEGAFSNAVNPFNGISTIEMFLMVFGGLFGLLLIFLGLIIAWIEYEDLKWEAREKKESKTRKKK